MTYRKVTHVLFDMDGLLLDTEKIYEKVFMDIVEKYGKHLSTDLRIQFLGSTERRSCEICTLELDLPITIDDFQTQFRALSQKRLENVEFMPGAERLVRHLHSNNVKICVATSSGCDSVAIKTRNHKEVFKLFHHIVMGSTDPEVKKGKPAPDIFIIAASRFDDKPKTEDCLVMEDAPNGVVGAMLAGCQAVMVPADFITEEMKIGATQVIKSLLDFQPELFGLPPFK